MAKHWFGGDSASKNLNKERNNSAECMVTCCSAKHTALESQNMVFPLSCRAKHNVRSQVQCLSLLVSPLFVVSFPF